MCSMYLWYRNELRNCCSSLYHLLKKNLDLFVCLLLWLRDTKWIFFLQSRQNQTNTSRQLIRLRLLSSSSRLSVCYDNSTLRRNKYAEMKALQRLSALRHVGEVRKLIMNVNKNKSRRPGVGPGSEGSMLLVASRTVKKVLPTLDFVMVIKKTQKQKHGGEC